jgi:hypothetical protein
MYFVGGSAALEPRPWNQGEEAQVPWSRRSLQTSYSSEFEAVRHHRREGAAGAATHHGLCTRKSCTSENPRSGSGPSVSARPEGDQPVEGAKNPKDGSCRVRQARVMQIPPPMSLKGRETPGGATRPGMAGEGTLARTLRGRRSLRKLPGDLRIARTAERRNASWSWKRRGGCGEPMTPLRRAERFGRPVNPERVVRGTATSRRNSLGAAETPGGDCSKNPMGVAGLSKIRWFSDW